MKRLLKSRQFLLSAFFILSISLYGEDRPNFVLILADDLGYGDLGFTGSTQIKTPHIDSLAREGVIFKQGYVSSAVCGPSRAGLMTGRNQVKFGFDNNLTTYLAQFKEEFHGLPVNEKTMASRLAELGYVNGLVGKWHLGDKEKYHPLKRGFHEFWGYLGGGHHYFQSKPKGKGYDCPIECNYKTPQAITYITDDKGDECVDFIRRHKDKPFFLFASFNAPHAPMHAKAEDLKLYSHIKDEKRRAYCAMTHNLDLNVGKIVSELKKQKLYENTLVVFLSDNGGPTPNNASLNAPLRGGKGILLEGGIRVPFSMTWPAKLKASSSYNHAVSSLDLAASFTELAGGKFKKEEMDGVNLIPFITGERAGQPHESLKWRFTISAAMVSGDWKLVRLPDRMPLLYNLKNDLAEQRNLAYEERERTELMLKQLGDWDVKLPHPIFLEGARWKKDQLKLYDRDWSLTQP